MSLSFNSENKNEANWDEIRELFGRQDIIMELFSVFLS
jgi:hypothetical protein